MVKCNLYRYMGENRLKIIDVAEATGLNRSTIARLYNDEAKRFEAEVLEKLCQYFDISVGDLIEYVPDEPNVK
ncbi:helix-turn-helix transcriptional regulator [Cardiobacteriaceae bacterium TAE3-ERU3]|nr:helix-turn-helix transcriptional regulator [Cardiobacteriaceae bacterium TAE3-ERU3]